MDVGSAAQLKAALLKDPVVIVLCLTEWSEPCHQIAAVLKELSTMHSNLTFLTVDIEEVSYVQKEYSVDAVPTVLFFKNGVVSDRVEGADPAELVQKVEALSKDTPQQTKELSLTQRIEQLIASADVLLFMKGSPEAPRCGFSSRVVEALNEAHIQFSHFDILQDEAMRQGIKEYSCWPTFPQLYVKGELMGGCDIISELKEKNQLQKEILAKAGETVLNESNQQKCERLTQMAPVMLFMKGTPDAPRCKFSTRVVNALKEAEITFSHFDILQDEAIRQGLKNYAQWPTFPQLYVHGELLGGCDIIEEKHSKGELAEHITAQIHSQNPGH